MTLLIVRVIGKIPYLRSIVFLMLIVINIGHVIQDLNAQSFIGISGGINFGKLSGDTPADFQYKSKLRPLAGLIFDLQLADDIYLCFKPAYVPLASVLQYEFRVDNQSYILDSIDIRGQFVALPLLIKLISDNKRFQFTAGPEITLPIKTVVDNSLEEEDISDQLNDFGFNVLFGMGYRISVGKTKVVLNADYSLGMTKIAKYIDNIESLLPRTRYSSLKISLDWLIPLKTKKDNKNQ